MESSVEDEHGYHSGSSSTIQCEGIMSKKINKAVQAVVLPVVSLPTTHKDVEKFSVRSSNEVEFVHLFKSNINEDVFVKCCSGICQSRFSKKRNIVHLYQNRQFCVHLVVFKEYLVLNKHKHPLLNSVNEEAVEDIENPDDDDDDVEFILEDNVDNDDNDVDIDTNDNADNTDKNIKVYIILSFDCEAIPLRNSWSFLHNWE